MTNLFARKVVFLIDRHNCLERSTAKVSRGKFNGAGKITSFSTAASNKHSPLNVYGGSFEGRKHLSEIVRWLQPC